MSGRYIRQNPYVDNHGIYMPINEYVPEGCESIYRCIMTKEMFVEAYNKWIAPKSKFEKYYSHSDDDADCWSDD